jgi:hypothetical protein
MRRTHLLLFILLTFVHSAYTNDLTRTAGGHLQQQYQNLLQNSEVIEGYRMLKVYEVDRFWRAVADSINEGKAALTEAKKVNTTLHNEIKTLTGSLEQKAAATEELLFNGKHIAVFNQNLKKSTFITIALLTTAILSGCIVLLIVLGKVNYKACRDARKLYEDLYAEFDQYRHNAVERQIKLTRELQDYRNRQMDLKSA